ncbi:MAG: hypothetical protein ACI84C_001631 [Flavobacteriales bacterium]|jgi:hypothetical protein
MLNVQQRIEAFAKLGKLMVLWGEEKQWPGFECGLSESEYAAVQASIPMAKIYNPWFTSDNVHKSLRSLGASMDMGSLEKWVSNYTFKEDKSLIVGLIMAGNIPLVGFHDVLCVLLSGHKAKIKMSSDDDKLFPAILSAVQILQPALTDQVLVMEDRLVEYDAILATGSNNTARYFEHYFGKVPNIIRKNRHSVAVLTGEETKEEIVALGHDIFDYFGLGCRSVSKLYLPEGYNFDHFFNGIFEFQDIVNHHKYANNYDYNKAVWLLNMEDLLDNEFILLRKCNDLTSPTGSLHYENYSDVATVHQQLDEMKDELQCVVGKGFLPFGKSQEPALDDYADGLDTMAWLASL